MHTSMEELGARLRRFREDAKLTQEELAALSGITQGTISRIETAIHKGVEVETLQPLAQALGIRTSDILGESEPTNDPILREINRLMEPASTYQKKAALGSVKGILAASDETG